MITVVTDSSARPPRSLRSSLRSRISVVPIVIHIGHRDVLGDDPSVAPLVYRALADGEPVKSSGPTVVEYLAAIDAADGAVVVTPATEFTTMAGNAALAAGLAERPARMIDSRTAGAAQGLVVAAGAEVASRGGSLDAVAAAIEDASSRARLVATIPTLDHIRRSGRVPAPVLSVASPPASPVFRLRDGLVESVTTYRGGDGAPTLRREAEREGWRPGSRSLVFGAGAADEAEVVRRTLGLDEPAVEFSPSMGIHTGPGVVGVAWLAAA